MAPPPIARAKIEALGETTILEQIASGKAQSEIARSVNVSIAALNEWLHSDSDRSARVTQAMTESAESWIDRGLAYVLEAERDAVEIQRARILEQHCARRAAIRNPRRYGDKLEVSGTVSIGAELAALNARRRDPELVERVEDQPRLTDGSV
jgi:transcriptional regulator with XRE-family HTH domain